ncbi:MAG: Inner membrane ABC transporter permease protein YejE [Ignavibacteria bacterium]|nr:Inner membrane ABC transporter permease protein YejE [Ignavibacteria bacterium]
MTEKDTIEKESLAPESNGLTKAQLESQKQVGASYWSLVKHQFKKNKLAIISLYIVAILVLMALSADFLASSKPLYAVYKGETYFPVIKDYLNNLGISKWDPELININWKSLDNENKLESVLWTPVPYGSTEVDLANSLSPPQGDHYLGTDGIGRDLLAGLIHGSRVSLSVGFIAAGIALVIGILLGSMAGYFGGKVDIVIMRFVEIMVTFPTFFLIITIVAIYGSSILYIMAAIGFTSWTSDAKLIRGEVLKVRNMEYITAANSIGLPHRQIIFRHVIPNAIAPVLVSGAFAIASAILVEASLSFLGFGVSATTVTWGSLLNEARGASSAWWLAIFPGFMIFIAVVTYNLIGEGLRDALDPRLRD